jgi:hypothetical protein
MVDGATQRYGESSKPTTDYTGFVFCRRKQGTTLWLTSSPLDLVPDTVGTFEDDIVTERAASVQKISPLLRACLGRVERAEDAFNIDMIPAGGIRRTSGGNGLINLDSRT